MTRDELARIGRLLYGREWQAPLAASLGISRSAVNQWQTGKRPVPEARAEQVRALARKRAIDIASALIGMHG